MNNKYKYLIIISLYITLNFLLVNKVNAYECNADSCVGGNSYTTNGLGWNAPSIPAAKQTIVGACNSPEYSYTVSGVAKCVEINHPAKGRFEPENPSVDKNGRRNMSLYSFGRVDAHGYNDGSSTIWEKIPEVSNVVIVPGMSLSYTRAEDISWAGGYIDEILYSIDTGQFNVSAEAVWSDKIMSGLSAVSVAPYDFTVNNVRVQRDYDGYWKLMYDVVISNLRVAGSNIYGMSGVSFQNNPLWDPTLAINYSEARAYHYYLPIKFNFSWLSNKCLGTYTYAKKYAEANPGTCCDQYPETCDLCTSLEYAKANPGITKTCCERYPETCCNIRTTKDGQTWIGTANNDGIWVKHYKDKWQGDKCCSDSTFKSNNLGKCPSSLISSIPTKSEKCLASTKTEYLYTTSYIQFDSTGKHLSRNINCNISGNGACTSTFTYKYTISVDNKLGYELNEIGHSYFNNIHVDDYNAYLTQRSKGKVTEVGGGVKIEPPKTYRTNSLADNNFSYKVSTPREDPSDSTKYLIDIEVTVYNLTQYYTNTPSAYDYKGTKVYFVPIKLSLCYRTKGGSGGSPTGTTCNDMSYAKANLTQCCLESTFKKNNPLLCPDPTVVTPPKSIGYTLNTSQSCNSGSKISNTFNFATTNTKIEETIDLNTDESPYVNSGTGFNFNISEVTNSVVYEATLTKGTITNPFDSFDSFNAEYQNFINYIDNKTNLFNNNINSLYNSQEIVFEVDNSEFDDKNINPRYLIENSGKTFSSTILGTENYYYKNTLYSCDQTCPVLDRFGNLIGYNYCWNNALGFMPPIVDVNGGNLVNTVCNAGNSGNAIYYVQKENKFKYDYKYKLKFPEAYMHKNKASEISYDGSKINNDSYLNAGNKFYVNITTPTGYYPFHIVIKNGGITGKINTSSSTGTAYSCSYLALDCANSGSCPTPACDPTKDPTCMPPTPGTSNFYFRPISLTNPFPNADVRETGQNWINFKKNDNYTYITKEEDNSDKGENVYNEVPLYEIKLTNQLAKEIRDYNKTHPDYSSYDTMIIVDGGSGLCNGLCRKSSFLTDLYSRGNLIIKGDYIDNRHNRNNGAIETEFGGDN